MISLIGIKIWHTKKAQLIPQVSLPLNAEAANRGVIRENVHWKSPVLESL